MAELPEAFHRWLKVLGPLPKADVPDFYDMLDLFAMPSRTDSFGIVYLEAWANGKPVIAAEAGGVVEVVRHEENGLLVPFGDVERLADSIGRLLDDRDLARHLGETGRSRTLREDATWEARFATLQDRVASIARARPSPTTGLESRAHRPERPRGARGPEPRAAFFDCLRTPSTV